MAQKNVNAAKTVQGAMTCQHAAYASRTDRLLWGRIVTSAVPPLAQTLEAKLQLADPTGCHISHVTGALSCLFPGQAEAWPPRPNHP